eukprot:365122-Chlamydomonas_euryale.AAC.25
MRQGAGHLLQKFCRSSAAVRPRAPVLDILRDLAERSCCMGYKSRVASYIHLRRHARAFPFSDTDV